MTRATPREFFVTNEFIFTLSTSLYKPETRSTKFETNPKFEKANSKLLGFENSDFGHCLLFRVSKFGFRIFPH